MGLPALLSTRAPNPLRQFPFSPMPAIIHASPSGRLFVDALNKSAWKSFLLPNGLLLVVVAAVLHAGWLNTVLPAVVFFNYAVLVVGLLLAWRFHSSRAFFALLALLLALMLAGLPILLHGCHGDEDRELLAIPGLVR